MFYILRCQWFKNLPLPIQFYWKQANHGVRFLSFYRSMQVHNSKQFLQAGFKRSLESVGIGICFKIRSSILKSNLVPYRDRPKPLHFPSPPSTCFEDTTLGPLLLAQPIAVYICKRTVKVDHLPASRSFTYIWRVCRGGTSQREPVVLEIEPSFI